MNARIAGLLGSLMMMAPVAAQENTYNILTSNVVSPDQPWATIEVWAAFDPAQYALSRCWFDLISSPDAGAFGDPEIILIGPEEYWGDVAPDGDSVTGIKIAQLHDPIAGIFADTSNPILMWQATWSTSDFSPRHVNLTTDTLRYTLYIDDFGTGQEFTNTVVEAMGTIVVVPGPAAASALVAGMLLSVQRHRR